MKITKNMPIPKQTYRGGATKYPELAKIIETWSVGDSVAFPCDLSKPKGRTAVPKEVAALLQRARLAKQKATQRILPDAGEIRVWRVE